MLTKCQKNINPNVFAGQLSIMSKARLFDFFYAIVLVAGKQVVPPTLQIYLQEPKM